MEDLQPKVVFRNVSKKYPNPTRRLDQLKGMFFSNKKKEFTAVDNISFTVYQGESVGIIGVNGSGKSTCSNMIAKVIPPSSGEIEINGKPSIIAIAAGLNHNLSGRDNIYQKGLMMGLSTSEIDEIFADIAEFSELGEFIEQPIKKYSTGMKSRLGFSISVHIEPDILIIDEALSVGDAKFAKKCEAKMAEFLSEEKTIFFVSHSMGQVQKICDKVIWIHKSKMIMFDDADKVIVKYNAFMAGDNKVPDELANIIENTTGGPTNLVNHDEKSKLSGIVDAAVVLGAVAMTVLSGLALVF